MNKNLSYDEKRIIIKNIVSNYLIENYFRITYNRQLYFSFEDKNHMIETGTNILLYKWKLLPYDPGDFIKSFCLNNLKETFSNADEINQKAIFFYILLNYNIGMPATLL